MASSDEDNSKKTGLGSSSDDEEIYPWWKAAVIALPQLGVQVMWMFLGPNTTPYLELLGADPSVATLNNSAGPIVGFLVGPLVGSWSDQSTSKWGRRRPVIVAGLVSTVIAGILYGGAERVMGKGNGVWLAAAMQWVLDFTVNAMQTPFRALVADLVSPKQQLPMQIFFSVVCAAGGFIAFTIMKLYPVPTEHMFELMGLVLLINIVCVAAALSVAREKQFVRTGRQGPQGGVCGPLATTFTGLKSGFDGMPAAFYLLLFISCMVWLGNTVWGSYGKVWFTAGVYPGDMKAAHGSVAHNAYIDGGAAFATAGQMGSIFQLPLALGLLGISLTTMPPNLIYAPCILVGAAVCFMCAFVVGHNHSLATVCFVLSNVPLTAAGSIPYGIVAVFNEQREARGGVGSVAMQMSILNCCITVGQQLCTMFLSGLESSFSVPEALKVLFIVSAVANGVAGLGAFCLSTKDTEGTTVEDGTETDGSSE